MNISNNINGKSGLESLPKDIIRLLLKYYLSNEDAIKCYIKIRIFYESCDKITLNLLKRIYFINILKFAPPNEPGKYYPNDWKACKCGVIYKNNTHRCLIRENIPEFCPDCSKHLIIKNFNFTGNTYFYYNHFKKKTQVCIAHSKALRNKCVKMKIKQKNERDFNESALIIYLMGVLTFSFGVYKYLY